VIARFEAERQALAMMDHPNVAHVFDAGATESGRPYFVMELVKGTPITEYCDRKNLGIPQRLELFVQVCQAVQHAHQKGLIHRDIKPSNVLVSSQDDRPTVKVIDFGVAKATQARLTEKTLFTEFHQFIGTPQYMSPEQAEGNLDVDTRSDVYSLGVLLYELLTGSTPFDPQELRSKAYGELQRIIREVDPPSPSNRLSTLESLPSVAAQRSTEPRKLTATIRGELDWIVMKCLEKDRARRYESAAALAAEITRYLADEPVTAAAPSQLYRVRKFVRRNRGPVLAAALLLLFLIGGITGTTIGLIGQARQREISQRKETEAQNQAGIARAVMTFQSDMLAAADPTKAMGDKVTALQVVMSAAGTLDQGKLKDQPIVEAAVRQTIGDTLVNLSRFDLAEPNLRKALELRRAALPAGHPDVASSLVSYAGVLHELARYPEAESTCREALALYRQLQPPLEAQLARCLVQLGCTLRVESKYKESHEMLDEAVDRYRKHLSGDKQGLAVAIGNLGWLLMDEGNAADATLLFQEALAINRVVLPPGHPSTAITLLNLAGTLADQRRYGEAEARIREAMATLQKVTPASECLSRCFEMLASVLKAQGKRADAEQAYRQALQINREIFPPDHIQIALSLGQLGLILQSEGKLDEAEASCRQSLQIARKAMPAGHRMIAQALGSLAYVLESEKKYAEAESCYREALEINRKALPPDHLETLQTMVNLAVDCRRQNRLDAAEPLLRESTEGFERAFGKSHWRTGNARYGLGIVLLDFNRLPEAEKELLEAERVVAVAPGASSSLHDKCLRSLVRLYSTWDKSDPGNGYAAKAAQWQARLPATRPATTTSPAG
jgi:tetratricopeptide (TPR) repeat protein